MLHRALKLIRVFHEMSQKELAERLGISRSHISELESGKKKPSYDLLEKYSDVFDVPVSNLIFFSEHIENIKEVELSNFRNIIASKILSIMEFVANKSGKVA